MQLQEIRYYICKSMIERLIGDSIVQAKQAKIRFLFIFVHSVALEVPFLLYTTSVTWSLEICLHHFYQATLHKLSEQLLPIWQTMLAFHSLEDFAKSVYPIFALLVISLIKTESASQLISIQLANVGSKYFGGHKACCWKAFYLQVIWCSYNLQYFSANYLLIVLALSIYAV